jgi:hypothetical protein
MGPGMAISIVAFLYEIQAVALELLVLEKLSFYICEI